MKKLISICLPTYNTAPYLPDRIATIRAQTFQDYEVVVCDSFSDDGSFEMLRQYSEVDKRVALSQIPKEGIYAGWNRCLLQATGEWVYIATSDDTMTNDCLETFETAIDRNPGVDVFTSLPWEIDESGADSGWGWDRTLRWVSGRRYSNDGPIDVEIEILWGLIIGTPTLSVTQMIVRRDLFERVGYFPVDLKSVADYYWQLRCLRQARWHHVGRRLGSWRRHSNQATSSEVDRFNDLRFEVALRLFREGWLGNSSAVLDALGYCAGISKANLADQLPPAAMARARAVRKNKNRLASSQFAALLRARFGIE